MDLEVEARARGRKLSVLITKTSECAPCQMHFCESPDCLAEIGVEEVFAWER